MASESMDERLVEVEVQGDEAKGKAEAQEKRRKVLERLEKKDTERRLRQEAKRKQAASERDPSEDPDKVMEDINGDVERIREALKGESPDYDALLERAKQAEELAAKAADFLPAQLARSCAERAAQVKAEVAESRPRGKFAFTVAQLQNEEIESGISKGLEPSAPVKQTAPGLRNMQGETVVIKPNGGSFTLEDLRDCYVHVATAIRTLSLRNVVECTVVAPCVSGSAFAESCSGCTLALCAGQLRLSMCSDCHAWCRCRSPPTLEGCANLGFSPLRSEEEQGEDESIMASVGAQEGRHDPGNVQDFDFLGPGQSPNWRLLTAEEASLQPSLHPREGALLLGPGDYS